MARSGRFCLAIARTAAAPGTSYPAPISARYGGGASGETCGRAHPTSDNVTAIITSLPRVVVDPTVRSDEPLDARLVDTVQGLEAGPRGQRDPARHRRIGREDDLCRILAHDARELVRDVRTRAVVLDDDAAVLEVVDLQLVGDRSCVNGPRGAVWGGGRAGGGGADVRLGAVS